MDTIGEIKLPLHDHLSKDWAVLEGEVIRFDDRLNAFLGGKNGRKEEASRSIVLGIDNTY